ncbi:MAG: hypothetical protein A3A44_00395 [Candidatus Sungbacteria bacterium RIFCSPLOWO2_01_FULL_60_25]|uniref:Uncharacterized protein n=1 Tax=Candidatus Sungbacteria bacterium RIFCSPLOWO2_01_FULL_60_25 TaxID=1802281 RepID=A0A1G2LER3_9BACT|nr:MAG: hypothetical protein A3A44_00395 [Candidatus Sungbacteria bacterium RIFCSPLOWO2_01_FULL_60_25]
MSRKFLTIAGIALLQLTPLAALAQVTNICSVLRLVNLAMNWFGILVFVVAVIAILYAAFLFLTAGGNEETTKKARTTLLYGLIGIAIALLALSSITFVAATIGGDQFNVDDCIAQVP